MGLGRNVDLTRSTDVQVRQPCDKTTEQIVAHLGWETEFADIEKTIMKL